MKRRILRKKKNDMTGAYYWPRDDGDANDDDAMSYSRNGGTCDARALCKCAVKYDVMSMQVGGREVKWAFSA